MKTYFKLIVFALTLLSLTNCAMPKPSAGAGWVYTGVKEGEYVNNGISISRSGEVCATNILGIASVGDATIESAKNSSGIKNIASIDRSYFSVLGVFAQGCTIIKGN